MRYVAPTREALDRSVLAAPPLSAWSCFAPLLRAEAWPSIDELNALWPAGARHRFVEQDKALLADGLHYEERIARHGAIATRRQTGTTFSTPSCGCATAPSSRP